MPYYTRVLLPQQALPPLKPLAAELERDYNVRLLIVAGDAGQWQSFRVARPSGKLLFSVTAELASGGSEAAEELQAFVEDASLWLPSANREWLLARLAETCCLLVIEHAEALATGEDEKGLDVLDATHAHLLGDTGLLQADEEGFYTHEGVYVLGTRHLVETQPLIAAIWQTGAWQAFELNPRNPAHTEAFENGEIPSGAKLWQERQ